MTDNNNQNGGKIAPGFRTSNSMPLTVPAPVETAIVPATTAQHAIPVQAAQEVMYSVPISIPGDLMNQLVSLSNENGISVSFICRQLVEKALNAQMLSEGIINDISEQAQEILKNVSLEGILEGLRIYNVPKAITAISKKNASDQQATINPTDLIFNTSSDVKEFIDNLNAVRALKGLAPVEQSICELLFHYGSSLADNSVCEEVTGIPFSKYKAITKNMALNEREQNDTKSNIIESSLFQSYKIIDTPLQPATIKAIA